MSDKQGVVGTLTKAKSKAGQEFLSIMGKNGKAVQDKKDKKAAKERLGLALTALAPWYDKAKVFGAGKVKTEGALQWPSSEHKEFASQIEKMEAAKKIDDYKTAADLAEQAKVFAEATDRTKKARDDLALEIKQVSTLLSGMTPPPGELKTRLAAELDAVRRGDKPEDILQRVQQIKSEASLGSTPSTGTKPPPTSGPTPSGPKLGSVENPYIVDMTTTDTTQAQQLAVARAKFIKDYRAVEAALARLADMVAPAVPAIATAVTGAKALIIKGDRYGEGEKTVATMLRQVEAARLQAETAAKAGAGTLANDIATLKTDLKKQPGASVERTKAAFAALQTELGQLDIIVKTNNTAAFSAAADQVKTIRAAGVTAAGAVAQFNETAAAIELITADKVVKKEFESENNDIILACKTLVTGLSLYGLPAAQKSMDGLKREADALKLRADALGPWREAMAEKLETLGKMIDEFHKLLPKAKDTTFELDYNEAKAKYDKPGVDRAAVTKMIEGATNLVYPIINNLRQPGATQEKTINALEANRKLGRVKLEEAEGKKQKAEQEVKDLERDLELLKTDLKTAAEKVKAVPFGDTEELDELKELASQARKKFDAKPKDLKGARSQQKAVRKRLDALLLTPGGVTANSVAELAKVDQLWTAAMDETRKLLDQIAKDAAPAVEAARLKPDEVKARTDELFQRFQPFKGTLVRSMKVLADETAQLKLRKSERELALRDLRSMRTIIDGNAVAAKLSVNPFGVAAPFGKLRRFIDNMEYNALRAVPPE